MRKRRGHRGKGACVVNQAEDMHLGSECLSLVKSRAMGRGIASGEDGRGDSGEEVHLTLHVRHHFQDRNVRVRK